MLRAQAKWVCGLLAAVLLMAAGCGGGGAKDSGANGGAAAGTAASKEAGPPSNQFVAAFPVEVVSLYPPKVADRSTLLQLFDPLLHRTPDGKTVGRLAESWTKKDDTTWEFKIRQGVKFHNGEPLTAETVKFSLDTYRDPKQSVSASRYATIKEVKVVDPTTVDVIMNRPDPFLPNNVTDNAMILPMKYIQDKGVDYFAAHPVGTGPYKFKEWIKGDRITMEAFPDYWGGKPKIQTAIWRVIPEASARYAAFASGEVDLVYDLPPAQVDSLKNSDKVAIKPLASPRAVYVGLWPKSPSTDGSPLTDPRVRQAMNYAVNRQAIVDTLLRGYGTLLGQPIPGAVYNGYNPDVKPYPYDPEKAKALLAEAGFPNGFSTELEYTGNFMTREQAQAVANDLGKVGIKVKLSEEEYGQFVKRLTQNRNQAPMYSLSIQGTAVMDSYEIYSIAIASNGSFNWNKYTDPKVDELVAKMGTTFDDAQRAELGKQVAQLTHDNPPWIFMWNNQVIWGIKKSWKWGPRPDDQVDIFDDVSW